jgi:hypothetical protein
MIIVYARNARRVKADVDILTNTFNSALNKRLVER